MRKVFPNHPKNKNTSPVEPSLAEIGAAILAERGHRANWVEGGNTEGSRFVGRMVLRVTEIHPDGTVVSDSQTDRQRLAAISAWADSVGLGVEELLIDWQPNGLSHVIVPEEAFEGTVMPRLQVLVTSQESQLPAAT